jgi:hypothetical protein
LEWRWLATRESVHSNGFSRIAQSLHFNQGRMNVADLKLVEAYRAASVLEAQAICCALQEAGVQVQVEGEMLQGGVGVLPTGWITAPRLLVAESQLALARKVLQQAAQERRRADLEKGESTRCLACGSDMAEREAQCGTCGWSYEN